MNSHVLNSPQTFQNHLKNSKNILLVHEVVVKRHAASRKRKCSLAEKNGFSLLLKNESNQLSKTSCTSRKTKLHQKRLKFTCKCEACSKCISQTIIEVLVHKTLAPKTFAASCKVQKTSKNISIPDVIPPFCSKSRAVHKEDIVVTKFQLPYQVMQKRSTCSPYQREFKLPYLSGSRDGSVASAWTLARNP